MSTSNLAAEIDADVSSASMANIVSAALSASVSPDPLPNQLQTSTAQEQKALEILQIVHNLGNTIKKVEENRPLDPNSHINKTTKRPGNHMTCEVCHRFQGRPSELK
jgi:hypothetical protein